MAENIKRKLASFYYNAGKTEVDPLLQFHAYWSAFRLLTQQEASEGTGMRQAIRNFIEDHFDTIDQSIDFEDEILDEYFLFPLFEDGRIEKEKDLYFYLDYIADRGFRRNDDYDNSIRNFQKLYNEMDLISLFMTILKAYDIVFARETVEYDIHMKKRIEGALFVLSGVLDELMK